MVKKNKKTNKASRYHFTDHADSKKLNAAVRHLKTEGIIKRDYEIADALNYSRPTVSEYINGKKQVSYSFLSKLEKHYNLDLAQLQNPIKSTSKVLEKTMKEIQNVLLRINQGLMIINNGNRTAAKSTRRVKAGVNTKVNIKAQKVVKKKIAKK